jgi:hypothetical protein
MKQKQKPEQVYPGLDLLPHHVELLSESAITPGVAGARGYRSVTKKAELKVLGYQDYQCSVPGLLHPIRGADGELRSYQYRPDQPRSKGGKAVKYESPTGSAAVIDIPEGARDKVGDPGVPLVVTEGARKVDSAISKGLVAISLSGVYGWRGRNQSGGLTALPDWEDIALNGRLVYLAFDSDAMTKREVYQALKRLKSFLEMRKATVRVVFLPAGENGTKTGLDDFFAGGGSVEGLMDLSSDELREPPEMAGDVAPRFARSDDGGITYFRESSQGVEAIDMANFNATIAEEVIEDDGESESRSLALHAECAGRQVDIEVTTSEFLSMNWPMEHLGPGAVLRAGAGFKDLAREAIQTLSPKPIPQRRVYSHMGWAVHAGEDVYLHAGGAIGAEGVVGDVDVRLEDAVGLFVLPPPPSGIELNDALRAVLKLLDGLAPDAVVFPLFPLPWMGVACSADFSVYVFGRTGNRKSELASLVQRCFGPELDRLRLPANWQSTANHNEALAFCAKDAVLVIDDFNPIGTKYDMIIVEVSGSDVDLDKLTECQGVAHLFSHAFSAFVSWMAKDKAGRLNMFVKWRDEEAKRLSKVGGHGRTPFSGAALVAGMQLFAHFAAEVGVLSEMEVHALVKRARAAIDVVVQQQERFLQAAQPEEIFIESISAALQSGFAHLADAKAGEVPLGDVGVDAELARFVGWRCSSSTSGEESWRAQGKCIGWVSKESGDVYLNPKASFAIAKEMGDRGGQSICIGDRSLWKALSEAGLLAGQDPDRNTHSVRLVGKTHKTVHLRLGVLCGESGTSGTRSPTPAHEAIAGVEGSVDPHDCSRSAWAPGTDNGNTAAPAPGEVADVPDVPDVEQGGGTSCTGTVCGAPAARDAEADEWEEV